jgi:hypothetical protein
MVVGGRRRSRRSVVVAWGVSGAKCGRLQSITVRGLGRRRCVRWQQWLKVAEGEGVGLVRGGRSVGRRRRGRRKRFWREKINASDFSFNSQIFLLFIYFFKVNNHGSHNQDLVLPPKILWAKYGSFKTPHVIILGTLK